MTVDRLGRVPLVIGQYASIERSAPVEDDDVTTHTQLSRRQFHWVLVGLGVFLIVLFPASLLIEDRSRPAGLVFGAASTLAVWIFVCGWLAPKSTVVREQARRGR
jgi:uncharacterized membrane protein